MKNGYFSFFEKIYDKTSLSCEVLSYRSEKSAGKSSSDCEGDVLFPGVELDFQPQNT